jgi:hypothetical protein
MQLHANKELKYQYEDMVLSLYGYCSVTPVACASLYLCMWKEELVFQLTLSTEKLFVNVFKQQHRI